MITALEKKSNEIKLNIPIFIKISPDESEQVLDNIITAVSDSFITGIIATNTTTCKSKIKNDEFKYPFSIFLRILFLFSVTSYPMIDNEYLIMD